MGLEGMVARVSVLGSEPVEPAPGRHLCHTYLTEVPMSSKMRAIPMLLIANVVLFAFTLSYVDQAAAAAQEIVSFCPDGSSNCKCADLDPWGPCGCHVDPWGSISDCDVNGDCAHVC